LDDLKKNVAGIHDSRNYSGLAGMEIWLGVNLWLNITEHFHRLN